YYTRPGWYTYITISPYVIPALHTWFQLCSTFNQPLYFGSREGSIPFFRIASLIIDLESGDKSLYSQSYPIATAMVISATSRKCGGFQSLNAAMASISFSAR